MGKIRVKVLGDEQQEQEELQKAREKREQKKAAKAADKGVASVGVSEEELMAQEPTTETQTETTEVSEPEGKEGKKTKKAKFAKKKAKSKRYASNASQVDKNTTYPLDKSIELLKSLQFSKFDETVELHVNVKEKGVSGQVDLPHGTGKQRKIKIADEAVIEAIEKGQIDFDVLVATPSVMPKLAKVARILGPRGLMPNPKAGTVTDNPEQAVEKLAGGQMSFKTEAGAPVIHMTVGKVSFEGGKLKDNITAAVKAIGVARIDKVTLKSTMSPAIRLNVSKM